MKLLNSEREFLIKKVKETVFDEVARKAFQKRYEEVRQYVLKHLEETQPKADMLIVQKYVSNIRRRKIYLKTRNYDCFTIELGCEVFAYRDEIIDNKLCDEMRLLRDKTNEKHDAVRKPYFSIIQAATTWEKLIEMWPEAKIYMPAKGEKSTALIPIEAVKSVKLDSKKREWK